MRQIYGRLQDAFIKFYKNLNDFDPDLKFSSWIYRIAHNETITFLRLYLFSGGVKIDKMIKIFYL